jgi:septum formation protein
MIKSLILASGSPRRQDLLKWFNIPFEIKVPMCEESLDSSLGLTEEIEKVAFQKAKTVEKIVEPHRYILAADTLVALNGEVLGKPKHKEEAVDMLKKLSGQTHIVITAVALLESGTNRFLLQHETSTVTFDTMPKDFINKYVNSGEPLDKAGAYGIQGGAALYIKKIEGCFYNIMGLPLSLVRKMLEDFNK